jgi:hypothetical protein
MYRDSMRFASRVGNTAARDLESAFGEFGRRAPRIQMQSPPDSFCVLVPSAEHNLTKGGIGALVPPRVTLGIFVPEIFL